MKARCDECYFGKAFDDRVECQCSKNTLKNQKRDDWCEHFIDQAEFEMLRCIEMEEQCKKPERESRADARGEMWIDHLNRSEKRAIDAEARAILFEQRYGEALEIHKRQNELLAEIAEEIRLGSR